MSNDYWDILAQPMEMITNHRNQAVASPPHRRNPFGRPLAEEVAEQKMNYDEGRAEEQMMLDEERYQGYGQ